MYMIETYYVGAWPSECYAVQTIVLSTNRTAALEGSPSATIILTLQEVFKFYLH